MMREVKPLTDEQCVALRPYYADLLARFRDVAQRGETDKPCPLCRACRAECLMCPVFGDGTARCSRFMPMPPGNSVVGEYNVYFLEDAESGVDVVRAWGAAVVAILEEAQARAAGLSKEQEP